MGNVLFQRVCLFLGVLFFINSGVRGQQTSYFLDSKSGSLPTVVLQENYWGNNYYMVNGVQLSPAGVRSLMNQTPSKDIQFGDGLRRMTNGRILTFSGQAVFFVSTVGFLSSALAGNQPATRNYLLAILGGTVMTIGGIITRNDGFRITQDAVDAYNYSLRGEYTTQPFLTMRRENAFLGPKIRVYEGGVPMNDSQLAYLRAQYSDLDMDLKLADKDFKKARVFDVISAIGSIAFVSYILIPQFQSSTSSSLLLPIALVDVTAVEFSRFYHRRARNTTRLGLNTFNFKD